MPEPVTVAIFMRVNENPSQRLATLDLPDPSTAHWEVATALRKIADEIEFQHLAANFD